MRIYKKYLSGEKKKKVHQLLDFQEKNEELQGYLNKTITVRHYYKPYEWNFYIQQVSSKKRILWYGLNFEPLKNKL